MTFQFKRFYRQLAATTVLSATLGAALFIASRPAPADAAAPRTIAVTQYGATINDTTDDTAAVQKAIDAAQTGDTVIFAPGTYYITRVGIKAGVNYQGRSATILRPVLPDVLPDGTAKRWVRTFDASMPGYSYSGDVDSAPTLIEGFTFYGNREAQSLSSQGWM